MDFGTLLHMAKKNSEDSKSDGKYYSTKFAPPKKESKDKRLSDNIQKFLKQKEEEEKRKQQQQQEKVNQLLSMRDERSKNKIKKMLKVTKSANRSVLEDAVNTEHTAITMQGPDQPDQDDYGYTSLEANSFYQKYIEKVKDVKEDKGFTPSRPQSLKDLTGTKERVKAALTREIEEKNSHTRTRVSHVKESSTSSGPTVARTSSKPIYDPEAERRQEEEERKKREEEKRKQKNRKPMPPPMDFQALLKLAEKKQHEPVEVLLEVKKKKEPERLLTMKERQEMEERQRAREARQHKERERNEEYNKSKNGDRGKGSTAATTTQRTEGFGRIPKLNQASESAPIQMNGGNSKSGSGSKSSSSSSLYKKPSSSSSNDKKSSNGNTSSSSGYSSKPSGNSANSLDKKPSSSSFNDKKPSNGSTLSSSAYSSKPSGNSATSSSSKCKNSSSSYSSQSASAKPSNKGGASSSSKSLTQNANSSSAFGKSAAQCGASSKAPSKNPYSSSSSSGPTKTREFPPRDVQKTRQFPPPDVRRGLASSSGKYGDSKSSAASKRRILDDDDSEYDSELDDFIDDGDEEEDYSSHIKAIFGYDKSRYRDEDFDDRDMESNFAQVQREEYISKKIGIKEDLEDMKMEAIEKKRKMMKKRRLLDD